MSELSPEEQHLPDPEVVVRPKRRRFSTAYKKRILEEADHATIPGEIGALLRREGLYWSNLSKWRLQRAAGRLEAMPKKTGRPKKPEHLTELERLRRENQRLKDDLRKAELVIDVQKKLSELLESTSPKTNDDT